MVKCVQAQCVETAYYGVFFGKPLTCKTHVGAGHGSVRRKCANDGCMMAAWATKTAMCDRCAKVYDDVEVYRRAKFRELSEQFGKEASMAGPPVAQLPEQKAVPAPPKLLAPARSVSMNAPATEKTGVGPIQQRAKTPGRVKAASLAMSVPDATKARIDAIGGH